ncbi:UNVERIFIED_CONTAM: hypothetical protein Slati_1368800 [Sesamum latifolium]|uniref:Uncharacterized protein n=1 Tax=Sesamum latifolium TaxID=2727402 RepID=A0AAW2XIS8_9LAMI
MPFAEQFLFLGLMSSQAFILRGESLSRASGGLGRSQGETSAKSLEERMERMREEMDDLKAAKKEAMAKYQKAEKEVKRLQREAQALQEEHAEELRAQADQVRKEFPETEERKNLLEACWPAVWQSTRSLMLMRRRLLWSLVLSFASPSRPVGNSSWPRGILL